MNTPAITLEEVLREVYEDLEGRVTCVCDHADGLRVSYRCRDWRAHERKLRIELLCRDAGVGDVSVGACGWIEVHERHPLLLDHVEPAQELYFTSAPDDPHALVRALHAEHEALFGDWLAPKRHVCATAATLATGNGLTARGPVSLIERLSAVASRHVRVNALPPGAPPRKEPLVVVQFGTQYVYCRSLELLGCEIED